MDEDALRLERSARNEAIFREANELLEARRTELSMVEGRTPFLCECGDPSCKAAIQLTIEEYEAVRAKANRFFLGAGHRAAEAAVVGETDRYVVVEKHGISGAVAEATNPHA